MIARRAAALPCALALLLTTACKEREQKPAGDPDPAPDPSSLVHAAPGVDYASRIIRIGALNDETGPARAIGGPFAIGKRLLVREVNTGGYLPEGWKLELVERDHGYDVERSLAHYEEIRDDVLFVSTVFGTASAVALQPLLKEDGMVAFPASLSSELADSPLTPPSAASYAAEAGRALDWYATEINDDPRRVAIVYDDDGYGRDALAGFRAAAAALELERVGEHAVPPGADNVDDIAAKLAARGATAVYLATLPTTTRAVLRAADRAGYRPAFFASTPAWTDTFFANEADHELFARFHWLSSLPFWGEDVPGMNRFLAAWDIHGVELGETDFYILTAYLGGRIQVEVLSRALAQERIDRQSFLAALQSLQGWTADGLLQEVSYSSFPYPSIRRVRVLRPDFPRRSWNVVGDFAEPSIGTTP